MGVAFLYLWPWPNEDTYLEQRYQAFRRRLRCGASRDCAHFDRRMALT